MGASDDPTSEDLLRIKPNRRVFYVYRHVDPVTGKTIYIGHGTSARAWICSKPSKHRKSETIGLRGGRFYKHYDWIRKHLDVGLTMADLVVIIKQGLTKQEAAKFENYLINYERPKFNHIYGTALVKLTPKQVAWVRKNYKRRSPNTYKSLAKRLNVSIMVVYRAVNGKGKIYNGTSNTVPRDHS